jgi:glucose/mannose-6-phosphate isomerase
VIDLEDPAGLEAGDPGGMLPALASAAAQLREATALCAEAGMERLAAAGRPRAVVLACSDVAAGSGSAAGLAAAAVGPATAVPVLVASSAEALPPWLGAADAVLLVTAAGGAAEAAVLDEALRRGAAVAVAAPARSAVAERAGRDSSVPSVVLPAARTHPGALWSLVTPLVVGAVALGLPGPVPGELEEAALRLETVAVACRPGSQTFVNPAKELALGLAERCVLVWGSSLLAQAAAGRLAATVTDWAATPAVAGALGTRARLLAGPFGGRPGGADLFADPFLDDPDAAAAPRLHAVLVRDEPGAEDDDVAERCARLVHAAEDRGVRVATVLAQGASRLERLASLVAFGDWAAAYLALLLGVDPTGGGL